MLIIIIIIMIIIIIIIIINSTYIAHILSKIIPCTVNQYQNLPLKRQS